MRVAQDNENDTAHIEDDAPLVIKYKYADQDHGPPADAKWVIEMKGKVLPKDKGIIHELFNDNPEEVEAEKEEEEPDESAEVQTKEKDILVTGKYKFVKEVVREPKIEFWKVPRLGSFMAVPLIYKSCLFENASD